MCVCVCADASLLVRVQSSIPSTVEQNASFHVAPDQTTLTWSLSRSFSKSWPLLCCLLWQNLSLYTHTTTTKIHIVIILVLLFSFPGLQGSNTIHWGRFSGVLLSPCSKVIQYSLLARQASFNDQWHSQLWHDVRDNKIHTHTHVYHITGFLFFLPTKSNAKTTIQDVCPKCHRAGLNLKHAQTWLCIP